MSTVTLTPMGGKRTGMITTMPETTGRTITTIKIMGGSPMTIPMNKQDDETVNYKRVRETSVFLK